MEYTSPPVGKAFAEDPEMNDFVSKEAETKPAESVV